MSLDNVKNFFPIRTMQSTKGGGIITHAGGSKSARRNISNEIMPTSLQLVTADLLGWRDAEREAIDAFFPYRWKMQKLMRDTMRNEHVAACVERRQDLTLTRKYEIQDADGKRDAFWTAYFEKTWFKQKTLKYILDAQAYGYTLVSAGDIVNGVPKNPIVVKRWYVNPDRRIVSRIQTPAPVGYSWDDPKYADWHIFIDTVSEDGISSCGFGYLYDVAKAEILHRNNLFYNTDFVEMYAQPIRTLKTNKTEGAERDAAEQALQKMGSAGYMIIDLLEELELKDGSGKGNAYKSYNDFEHRLEQKISKRILGHADAVDSVPGKLGSAQLTSTGAPNSDHMANSPVGKALRDKQTKDGAFVEPVVNEQVIPKLRALGIAIPEGLQFKFLNDAEERAIQDEKNNTNQKLATFVMTLAQGNVRVKTPYISEATGIPEEYLEVMEVDEGNNAPNPLKEPGDQIKSKKPLKESSKNRPGKQ